MDDNGQSREIYRISPYLVDIPLKPFIRDVTRQKVRLEQEGQIEPICVKPTGNGRYVLDVSNPDFWVYSGEQVEAAKMLNWDTILVTY